jgi:hypothetical protein
MQGANKRTGNMLKKARITASESATCGPATDDSANDEPDEPPTDELPNDVSANEKPTTDESANHESATAESVSESAALEPISDQAIIKPNTMELLETSRDAPYRENTDGIMARSALVSPVDETAVGRPVDSDLPMITHADGIAILDEYFPKSTIESRPLKGAVAPDELSTSTADITCRDFPLVPLTPSLAPEELDTSPDIVSSESPRIPNLHQATGGFEMPTPNASSLQSVSSCGNSSSCISSETDSTDIGLLDIATHTPFAR